MEMLGEALQVAPVEELDLDVRVSLAQLAQLPVLAGHERLFHGGDLDVEVLIGEVEVGFEWPAEIFLGRFDLVGTER